MIGRISDTLNRINNNNETDMLIVHSYANYGKGTNYGIEMAANVNITDWWSLNTSLNAYYQKIDGSNIGSEYTTKGAAWFAKIMSDFVLWKGANAQLSYYYRAPKDIPTGRIQAFNKMDMAIKQKFLKNKASLMLSVQDPFGMMRFELEKHTDAYNMFMERDMEDFVYMITFSYRFGKLRDNDAQKRKRGDRNGGEDMEDMY